MSWGRRDNNEAQIVAALQKAGCDVEYSEKRQWDLIVGRAGQTFLLEVKGKKGELRDSQIEFQQNWRGHYAVVRTPAEALGAVGL